MLQLSKDGYIDPKSVAYDQTLHEPDRTGAAALQVGTPKWPSTSSVRLPRYCRRSPVKSPSGKTGTLLDQQLMSTTGTRTQVGVRVVRATRR